MKPFPVPFQPGTDHGRRHEAAGTGGQVDDVAAGEVTGALMRPEAAAPEEEGVDRVGKCGPQGHENDPDLELDAAQDAAQEQQGRDGGEDELEVDDAGLGYAKRRHARVDLRDGPLFLQGEGAQRRGRFTHEVIE